MSANVPDSLRNLLKHTHIARINVWPDRVRSAAWKGIFATLDMRWPSLSKALENWSSDIELVFFLRQLVLCKMSDW